jgi:hypothetical protein
MMIFTPSAALITTGEDQNELTSVGPGASRGGSGRIDDALFLNELSSSSHVNYSFYETDY